MSAQFPNIITEGKDEATTNSFKLAKDVFKHQEDAELKLAKRKRSNRNKISTRSYEANFA